MKNFPKKITSENFNNAEKMISSATASVEKKGKTKKISRPISNLLFVFFSLIFIYGVAYKATPAEEAIVFEKLTPITKIWIFFDNILIKPDMNWYVLGGVLVAVTFVVPLLVTAIIKVLVSVTHISKKHQFSENDTIKNAKKLHSLATNLKEKSYRYSNKASNIPYVLIFTLLVIAFFVHAYLALKIDTSSILLGFIVAAVVLFLVYSLIFKIFSAINGLFYKIKRVDVTSITYSYWLSVDPEEAERREAEARRNAENRRYESTYKTAGSNKAIDEIDSFTWTGTYVRNNERKCSDTALNILKVSKDLLGERDYKGAAEGFKRVIRALELLKDVDREHYLPPLYANCYALSMIYAFGLNDREFACKCAEKACEYASRCNSTKARNDLRTMNDFYNALRSSSSLSSIANRFEINFPRTVINM
ncbi:MAG: hypothetical protein ACI4GC_00975 [Acutalibacteraceae bacterium]